MASSSAAPHPSGTGSSGVDSHQRFSPRDLYAVISDDEGDPLPIPLEIPDHRGPSTPDFAGVPTVPTLEIPSLDFNTDAPPPQQHQPPAPNFTYRSLTPQTLQLPQLPFMSRRPLHLPESIISESENMQQRESTGSHGIIPTFSRSSKDAAQATRRPWSCSCLRRSDFYLLRPSVHGAVIASLAACDGVRTGPGPDVSWLIVFGSVLLALLLGVQLLSLQRGRAYWPPRLVLALLHAGAAIFAFRSKMLLADQSLRSEDGRLALTVGFLQLFSVLLYPTSSVTVFAMTVVSYAALALHQLTWDEPRHAWGPDLVLLLLACASAVVASEESRPLLPELLFVRCQPSGLASARAVSPLDAQKVDTLTELNGLAADMQEAFRPIFSLKHKHGGGASGSDEDTPQVGTYLSHILAGITSTTQNMMEMDSLQEPVREVIVRALSIIVKELGQTSTLQRIPESALANSSSVIVNYVQTMLHPTVAADTVLSNARMGTNTDSLVSGVTPGRSNHPHNSVCSGASSVVTEDMRISQYNDVCDQMLSVLNPSRGHVKKNIPRMSRAQGNQLMVATGFELGAWHSNLFTVFECAERQPILVLGRMAVQAHTERLSIDPNRVACFLEAIEDRYCDNPYHNSLHGADVMNSLLYFLKLPTEPMTILDDFEKLTCLLVACAHDVGHTGRANRFHTITQSPLAQLFNDQSVLENLHCATMFAVLRVEACNVLEGMDNAAQALFRTLAVQMILGTDLAKHVEAVSHFRQQYIERGRPGAPGGCSSELTPVQRRDFVSFLLKCSDVGGSAKPFSLHVQWSMRVCSEFYAQGDAEDALGLPPSAFCDRKNNALSECQTGFFNFVVTPMFNALGEYLKSPKVQSEVLDTMAQNRRFWKNFDDEGVDHSDPMVNVARLQLAFMKSSTATCRSFAALSVASKQKS